MCGGGEREVCFGKHCVVRLECLCHLTRLLTLLPLASLIQTRLTVCFMQLIVRRSNCSSSAVLSVANLHYQRKPLHTSRSHLTDRFMHLIVWKANYSSSAVLSIIASLNYDQEKPLISSVQTLTLVGPTGYHSLFALSESNVVLLIYCLYPLAYESRNSLMSTLTSSLSLTSSFRFGRLPQLFKKIIRYLGYDDEFNSINTLQV